MLSRGKLAVLSIVLREAFSSCVGAVVISEDIGKDRSLLIKWLVEFGLATSSASVTLLTDAELRPQFGSFGSLVFAYVRVGHEFMPKVFVARSIKLVFPIELVFELREIWVFRGL